MSRGTPIPRRESYSQELENTVFGETVDYHSGRIISV